MTRQTPRPHPPPRPTLWRCLLNDHPPLTQPFQRLDRTARRPYALGHYAKRAAWNAVYALLIRPSFRRAARWRRFWLRTFGASLGTTTLIRPSTRIFAPWLLTLGDYSAIGDDVRVYNLGHITIGSHTVISQNVHLCAGTHDYTRPDLPLIRSNIVIGSGVWICADAFIGPDVTIGDNAIVGARAVVTKDVPPNVIVAGNPAKMIKDRPRPEDA